MFKDMELSKDIMLAFKQVGHFIRLFRRRKTSQWLLLHATKKFLPIFYLVHNSKLKLVNVGQKEHLDLNTDIYSLLLYVTGLWFNPKRQFLP